MPAGQRRDQPAVDLLRKRTGRIARTHSRLDVHNLEPPVETGKRTRECRRRVTLDHDRVRPNGVKHRVERTQQAAQQLIERAARAINGQMMRDIDAQGGQQRRQQVGMLRCRDDRDRDGRPASRQLAQHRHQLDRLRPRADDNGNADR